MLKRWRSCRGPTALQPPLISTLLSDTGRAAWNLHSRITKQVISSKYMYISILTNSALSAYSIKFSLQISCKIHISKSYPRANGGKFSYFTAVYSMKPFPQETEELVYKTEITWTTKPTVKTWNAQFHYQDPGCEDHRGRWQFFSHQKWSSCSTTVWSSAYSQMTSKDKLYSYKRWTKTSGKKTAYFKT